jgi:hypothetical protein
LVHEELQEKEAFEKNGSLNVISQDFSFLTSLLNNIIDKDLLCECVMKKVVMFYITYVLYRTDL